MRPGGGCALLILASPGHKAAKECTKLCYEGVDSTRSAGRQWGPSLRAGSDLVQGHVGSRAEKKVTPLFFRVSEMQLNLEQNIWAVLALLGLFMLFPTHISDQKQIVHWSRSLRHLHTGSTSGLDSPRDG